MSALSNYFNLEKSFAFYGAYHRDTINKAVHIVFVPTIFTMSIHYVSLYSPSLAKFLAGLYGISFIATGSGLTNTSNITNTSILTTITSVSPFQTSRFVDNNNKLSTRTIGSVHLLLFP